MAFKRRMSELLQTSWVAYSIRETAIVTIGIIIAFALNAWWEDRKQSRDEVRHLRALASDFASNAAELKALIEFEDSIATASLQLLKVENPKAPENGFVNLLNSRRFDPRMGAYEALVNSAGLTLITDEELRADLAEFAAAVNVRYGEELSDRLYFEFVREFTGRFGVANVVLDRPADPAQYTALLADARFREYLAFRYAAERDVGNYYKRLLRICERINTRVKAAEH